MQSPARMVGPRPVDRRTPQQQCRRFQLSTMAVWVMTRFSGTAGQGVYATHGTYP